MPEFEVCGASAAAAPSASGSILDWPTTPLTHAVRTRVPVRAWRCGAVRLSRRIWQVAPLQASLLPGFSRAPTARLQGPSHQGTTGKRQGDLCDYDS